VREGVFRHQECRANIAPDVLIEFIDGCVFGFCSNEKNTSVIDQHVELAKTLDCGINARLRVVLV
jgi:hypothetical protein